jgi:hypothetical protein
MSLRVDDTDFSASPAKIRLKARVNKTRKKRITFISNEAAE